MKNNKHIKAVTRDRASVYAKAIEETLPYTMQIADRFHLHQNLLEAIRGALYGSVPATVKIPVNADDPEFEEEYKDVKKLFSNNDEVSQVTVLIPEKVELYEEIHRMHNAGYSLRKIEKELNCSRNTMRKYIHSDIVSICSSTLMSGVDKYHNHIVRELSAGKCRSVLYRELLAIVLTCKKTAAYDYFNRIVKLYNGKAYYVWQIWMQASYN